jgi:hypothetical protein
MTKLKHGSYIESEFLLAESKEFIYFLYCSFSWPVGRKRRTNYRVNAESAVLRVLISRYNNRSNIIPDILQPIRGQNARWQKARCTPAIQT